MPRRASGMRENVDSSIPLDRSTANTRSHASDSEEFERGDVASSRTYSPAQASEVPTARNEMSRPGAIPRSNGLIAGRSVTSPASDAGRSGQEASTSTASVQLKGSDPQTRSMTTGDPTRTSIWDWDAVEEDTGSSTYEPQGELLQEQSERQLPVTEFGVQHAVNTTPLIDGPNDNASSRREGFAAAQMPPAVEPDAIGTKRKVISDYPDERSPMLSLNGQEARSPTVERPPFKRIRSQKNTCPDSAEHRQAQIAASTREQAEASLTEPPTPSNLPAQQVFPIQIGERLFRLSGASISSDAPSYFSQFFEQQLQQNGGNADTVRTLYIDRDPATFEDIALHLQGYHVEPRDSSHFVRLFADAQFFSLQRLTTQLFSSTIYIKIGDQEFQISKDLFNSSGDWPNYFSLGFAMFFTTPTDVFPGLSQQDLLRPPSLKSPSVTGRSAKTFADLLHILKGYPVEVRNEEHRTELLRDARYFHLKGLEQRLLPHSITYNLARRAMEIVIRLDDIRQSGISFVADPANSSSSTFPISPSDSSVPSGPGWVYYQRPHVDAEAYNLIVEMSGDESMSILIPASSSAARARFGQATFHRQALSRITSLFTLIANKMDLAVTKPLGLMMTESGAASLPIGSSTTGISDDRVKVRLGLDADVMIDGRPWYVNDRSSEPDAEDDEDIMDVEGKNTRTTTGQRKQAAGEERAAEEWVVRKAQWRLRVQPLQGNTQSLGRRGMEIILGAVKIEGFRSERGRNASRGFLG